MKKLLLVYALVFNLSIVYGQSQVLLQEHFEQLAADRSLPGVKGKALNLTATAAKRKPLRMELSAAPSTGSFTVVIWIKAAPVDDESYVVLSNSTAGMDSTETIWELGKQAGGTWYWTAVCGKTRYEYRPTLQRQPVNDGKWHQLSFSFNDEKKEVRMYYDGKNVAIYYTPQLTSLLTKHSQLTIGGREKGDLGEWESFNGMLDEVEVYGGIASKKEVSTPFVGQLKVMNYNIWHGGNETGKYIGPMRIAEIIKQAGADIISMQETYGSGARIADALGYYFYLRSTNLSIMSRFPIAETITGEEPFYNGAAYISLGSGKQVLFATNWLNYPFDYWDDLEKNVVIDSDLWVAGMEKANAGKLKQILEAIKSDVRNEVPVIFCGDFNTGSHLDWTAATRHLNNGHIMPFPSGILMEKAGFKDAFRVIHPDPLKDRGITWSPQFPKAFKDRIDYIYYKGNGLVPIASKVIDTHHTAYPSDHGALVTTFKLLP
uniref:endonuclease/exonuclease/phosphatase family protein n=1 Tax=Pedobacter schmidteae TaxID=2201271 RepID=UPI000EAD56AE|nr:endonuclease/exonuclease/phosphatase family protein [Pedobacter schmidteae]